MVVMVGSMMGQCWWSSTAGLLSPTLAGQSHEFIASANSTTNQSSVVSSNFGLLLHHDLE
jgi:hypothetical protein